MTARPRLLVLDAPGGPRPHQYLPSLLREFDVHVVWLAVEGPAARRTRAAAVAAALSSVAVDQPERLGEAAENVARGHAVDGVFALSERTAGVAARVADRLGLPANPLETSEALQDKRKQRDLLAAGGLATPALRVLRTAADCRAAATSMRFPAVLKPAVGMGSLATFRVERADRLGAAWRLARTLVDADARVAHLRPDLLLEEEFLGTADAQPAGLGDYLSVETLTVAGHTHVLAVSDKLPLAPPFRENGHLLPTVRPEADTRDAVDSALRAVRALGVTTGACHTEVKLTGEGPRIIEVNGRPGGFVPELLQLASGYDLALELARVLCGRTAATDVRCVRHAACLTPQPPLGRHRVELAPTEDQVRGVDGVVTVYRLAETGSVLDSDVGSSHNLFRLSVVADRRDELLRIGRRLVEPDFFRLAPLDTTP